MANVSILIPAFKPDFLREAIVSAQGQEFRDIEILVGDDSPDGCLQSVVEELAASDDRVHYVRHGFGHTFKNSLGLWKKASGRFVKWLYDDDLLLPKSVSSLVTAIHEHPGAAFAFHERVFIDGQSQVIHKPKPIMPERQYALLDRGFLVKHMVARASNFIGEPSNIMIDRERFPSFDQAFVYEDYELIYIADVALYLNCAEVGPAVAVSGYHSAFRRHDGQASTEDSPILSAGYFEWEMMMRGEVARGTLEKSALPAGVTRLREFYETEVTRYPELGPLLEGLQELEYPPADPLRSPVYAANLESARKQALDRFYARRRAAQMPKFCSLCDEVVNQWLPSANPNQKQAAFLLEVERVGARAHEHLCPCCRSNDRERHLWLYMSRAGVLEDMASKRVLHIAPEAFLKARITALHPQTYVTVEVSADEAVPNGVDWHALEFGDGSFDLILCNHVLESVDNPRLALAELHRCLSPAGHLIAQTPFSPVMKSTLELKKTPNREFRARYFGGECDRRLFGADILDYFSSVGLQGALLPHEQLLGDIDPDRHGVNVREPFFLFGKQQAPLLPAVAS